MRFITLLLTTEHANSRFVYCTQGLAVATGILILIVAYVISHDPSQRDGYISMMMVLLGGGSLNTVARGYQKGKTGDTGPTTPPA